MDKKFAICIYGYSAKPEDYGVSRRWFVSGSGDNVRWSVNFDPKFAMPLDQALRAYELLDSPMRRLGLVPV